MKKIFALIVIGMLLLVNVNVFAKEEGKNEISGEVSEIVESSAGSELSDETREIVKPYIEDFVEKRGIEAGQIKKITQVDFGNLPKEVNIENVGDSNLAIYEVDYKDLSEKGEEKKVFVISYSVEKLKSQGDIILAQDRRMFLDFGFAGQNNESTFLKTATEVEGSSEQGYVMMRHGSITGLSTNLNVEIAGKADIEIVIYKNGKEVGFRNSLDAGETGVKKDYDIQTKALVQFEPGDIISAKLNVLSSEKEQIVWSDAITLVEITTEN